MSERCSVCGGPIIQRYTDGPYIHVNLDDWSTSPHEALPIVTLHVVDEPDETDDDA